MYDTKIYAYEFIPSHKKRNPKVPFLFIQFLDISTDGWSGESNRSAFSSSQVQREVVCVALVHYLHPEVGTVEDISPGVKNTSL